MKFYQSAAVALELYLLIAPANAVAFFPGALVWRIR
jgi:hypothetical protein